LSGKRRFCPVILLNEFHCLFIILLCSRG
jgi:hypothetical protein